VITCPVLVESAEVDISYTDDQNIGSIATFSCDPGFLLIGGGALSCSEEGEWNSTTPSCQR